MNKIEPRTAWFKKARFGMFIHWSLFSLHGQGCFVNKMIAEGNYDKYFHNFNPDLFDPEVWADYAARAGMKYVVVIAKHHEGFCLWDTKYSKYKAPLTPAGKDLLLPILKAFRKKGIKTGIYYSLLDWHHPDFVIDCLHPLRYEENVLKLNKKRSMDKYVDYMEKQLQELLTKYGPVDILWCDYSYEHYGNHPEWKKRGLKGKGANDWQSERLIKKIRKLHPEILINDRMGIDQDFCTAEQWLPIKETEKMKALSVWESCHTLNEKWAYCPTAKEWKTPEQLISILIQAVSHNGNLILNIAPNGRGEIDEQTKQSLDIYAEWMKYHGKAIWECEAANFPPPDGCLYTRKGNKLYLHILKWPYKHLHIPELAGKIEYAQFLHDASEIKTEIPAPVEGHTHLRVETNPNGVVAYLPVEKPNVTIPVIEISLK